MKTTISLIDKNQRLDKYLAEKHPEHTRTFWQKLIKAGHVKINKKTASAHYQLQKTDKINIKIPKPEIIKTKKEKIALDIVYEDSDIIVINKPAGMVVHPTESGNNLTGTLVNAVLYHAKDLSGIGGQLRPGIVHRLDKDTSGLIMIAKNDESHQYLSEQIKSRQVKKIYLTLVKGHLANKTGRIDAPIGRSLSDRKKMAVSNRKEAKKALTEYQVLKEFNKSGFDYSLLEINLLTGRTHQIRVHLSAIGHPVIGDTTYGDDKINAIFQKLGLNRQFLHAKELKIKIPMNKRWKTFKTELPKNLERVINDLTK